MKAGFCVGKIINVQIGKNDVQVGAGPFCFPAYVITVENKPFFGCDSKFPSNLKRIYSFPLGSKNKIYYL